MKTHTSGFKDEIKTLGKQQSVRITYTLNDEQIILTNEDINSATPNYEASLLKSVMKGLDIDSNVIIPKGTEIKFEYGLLVNGTYEYLNYGNYIVAKEPEKQEDTLSYKITCYDKMLYSMKDYEHIDITYPTTIYNFLKKLCEKIGLTMKEANFANMLRQVPSELFMTVNEDGTYSSMGYTYRDVLDQIAETTGGCICMTLDDKVEVRYINKTNDTIDEEYINDTNVNFGEKYGPINSIVLARAGESDKIYKKDQNSIDNNGLCELMISENQFMNLNDRVDYLQELSEKLFGVEYYLNDFVSTGIMYYDLLDMYNIEIFGKTYNCLMLNDEQDITQGLEENIHTDRPETSETDYKKADTTDRKINQTYLIVDKQNKKIEGVISQIGDRSNKKTTITADIDGINSKVSDIEDLTQTAKGVKTVTLDNCIEGNLLELHIYGNNTVFDYITLSDNLVLSDDLHPKGDSLITVTDKDGKKTEYELNISEPLRQNGDAYDEYILKYGKAQVIRRINADGTIKSTAITEEIKAAKIPLKEGKNILTIKNYTASLSAKYAIKSSYSETFATNVKMDSEIKQTAQSIDLSVNKKLESYSTTEEMNSAIKLKTDSIATEVSKKVGKTEVGTYIEQNVDAIKYAWNQISEFIQMMIINNNASFAILDENKKILMALDKTGQHFYKSDGTTIFGEIGVNKEGNDTYISFEVDGKYGDNITNGMAWGIKTKSDNKFHPIMYLKNYQVVQQGGSYGQLMLTNADLVLTGSVDEGTGGGIQCGDILFGGSALNGLKFVDTNGNNFINIVKGDNTILKPYDMIEFLDEVIFFKNALGGNSLGIGKKYSAGAFTGCKAVITDDGSIALDGNITLGSSLYWGSGSSLDSNGNVTCKKLYETSLAEKKKNFEKMNDSALEIIKGIDIYRYNLKVEKDTDKKHLGFIIGENFNYSKEITSIDNTSVDNYSFTSLCCKAIQEQQEQIEELKKEIEKLKGEKNGEN